MGLSMQSLHAGGADDRTDRQRKRHLPVSACRAPRLGRIQPDDLVEAPEPDKERCVRDQLDDLGL